MSIKPFDLSNAVVGSVRVLWAPIGQDVPTKLQDVFDQTSPYDPVEDWKDFGIQKSAFDYSRDINTQGNQIQQVTGDVFEEVTEVKRTFKVSIGELTAETLQIIENAPSIATVGAESGANSQKGIAYGSIIDLVQYRLAFVGLRKAGYSAATEPSGAVRGTFIGNAAYRTQISADNVAVSADKGNLWEAVVTFDTFPEPGEDDGAEYGTWLLEDTGVIT